NSIGRAKARLRAAKRKYAQLVRAKTNNTNAAMVAHQQSSKSSPQSRATQTAKEPRKFRDDFDAVCQAKPELDRLARYERRAWSRQKRAIRAFIEIKSSGEQIDAAIDCKPDRKRPV